MGGGTVKSPTPSPDVRSDRGVTSGDHLAPSPPHCRYHDVFPTR